MKYFKTDEKIDFSKEGMIVPWELFTDSYYKDLRPEPKLLYGYFKSLMEHSVEQLWYGPEKRMYIQVSRLVIAKDLGLAEKTVRNYVEKLIQFDLMEKLKGIKPSAYYILKPQSKRLPRE